MKSNYIFLCISLLFYIHIYSQSASLNSGNGHGYSNSESYSSDFWNDDDHSSSSYGNIISVYNNQNKNYILKVTIENSTSFSNDVLDTYIPAYSGPGYTFSENIILDFSNPPSSSTICIDGRVTFKFTPAINPNTPTGEPAIYMYDYICWGYTDRSFRATNINNNYTTIDNIDVTTFYVEYDNGGTTTTNYTDYTYRTTNISSVLISKLISLHVPTDIPVANSSGSNVVNIDGNTASPIKILPGARLRGVPNSYFNRTNPTSKIANPDNNISEYALPANIEKTKIFPNIFDQSLTIKTKDDSKYKVYIYNLQNILVAETTLNARINTIDLSQLSSSCWYIVNIINENGEMENLKIYKK